MPPRSVGTLPSVVYRSRAPGVAQLRVTDATMTKVPPLGEMTGSATARSDVGSWLGAGDRDRDGAALGSALGLELGLALGLSLGLALGSRLGRAVGWALSWALGWALGLALGLRLGRGDGRGTGLSEVGREGRSEGANDAAAMVVVGARLSSSSWLPNNGGTVEGADCVAESNAPGGQQHSATFRTTQVQATGAGSERRRRMGNHRYVPARVILRRRWCRMLSSVIYAFYLLVQPV